MLELSEKHVLVTPLSQTIPNPPKKADIMKVWHFTVKNTPTTVALKQSNIGWVVDVKKNGKLEQTEGPFKTEADALGQAFILIERLRGQDNE